MRKKYRVRRPKLRFGPVLFPLVSVLLVIGTAYGWMSFLRSSSSDGLESFPDVRKPVAAVSPAGEAVTGAPAPQEGETVLPVVAVPQGGESPLQVLPGKEVPQDSKHVGALPQGFGDIPANIWILVDKSDMSLYLCKGRDILKKYPVGMGKNPGNKQKSGDKRTPEGRFSIEKIHDSSGWTHDYKDGRGPVKGVYGPWFLRLRMPWSGLGICGTPDPDLVGKNTTRGSLRMLNPDIEELRKKIQLGTVVVIKP